jgi:hypothetical protein
MRPRPRALPVVLGLTLSLLAGCTSDDALDRHPGDPVTAAEAEALAELLHRNYTRGGADFVITAPWSDGVVLTLTGEVDFRGAVGRAQAVTSFPGGQEDTRTVFFSREEVWFGDVPGLAEALADDGAVGASYLRRPVTTGTDDAQPELLDVLLEVLLNLSSRTPDDPQAFLDGSYTWEGQRSIDSRLTTLFGLREDRTVAVASADDVLAQFETPLADGDFDATVTLSDHGRRALDVPAETETADAADHSAVAALFGV